jgi:PIN domain nuclease of toxin-antitoxin system
LRRSEPELWLSPITLWEALILAERGRLELEGDPQPWIDEALRRAPLHEAPITHEIARESRSVQLPHDDPADRFLAATARVLNLTLVTADRRLIAAPDIPVIPNR